MPSPPAMDDGSGQQLLGSNFFGDTVAVCWWFGEMKVGLGLWVGMEDDFFF